MSLTIEEIGSPQQWDSLILPWKPNTFLQSWEWGQVQQAHGEAVRYLGFKDGTTWVGVALVVLVNARRGRHYLVPHGPLVRDAERLSEIVQALTRYCQKHAAADKMVALRVAPLALASDQTQALFSELGFKAAPLHVHSERTWVTDLTQTEEQLLRDMRKTTRHAIRKNTEAVQVEFVQEAQAVGRFWPLYEATRTRHRFVPWPKRLIEAQFQAFGHHDRALAAFATVNGQDVSGALFMRYGTTLFYHHGASVLAPGNVPAAHVLHWEAMKHAKSNGVARYNWWGIAPDNAPRHPFRGITTFKKGFGGEVFNYLPAQDLPLSTGYAFLYLVDRYRKWRRGF